jgi:hypothetical protein
MFDRLTRHFRKSLRTEVPSSLATGTLGSRNPSCVSVQQVSFLKNDMVGLRQPRYYNDIQVSLERTNSHSVSPSKKAATTYFTRQGRLPHWVNPAWVLPTRQLFDRIKHPDWWKAYQEDLKRPRDTSVGMTDYVVDPNEAFRPVLFPISHKNTANYPNIDQIFEEEQAKAQRLASKRPDPPAKSKPPRKTKLPPRDGGLRQGDEAYERDLVTTIGSFVSGVTRRVMDHFERRTLDSKGQPVRRRLKKRDRFPIQPNSEDETNTLVVEPSSTVYSPVGVPSPSTLITNLNSPPQNSPPARVPARVTKPRPPTVSPAHSTYLPDPPGTPDKKTGRRLSYDFVRSRSSRLRRRTPSPHAAPPRPPYNPNSNVTSTPLVPKIEMDFSVGPGDWGSLSVNGSPPSETGKSCTSGTTLVGGEEGSVSSACDHGSNRPQYSAAGIIAPQRGDSGASIGSWTTAGSVNDCKLNGPQSVSNRETDFEKPGHPHFVLTTLPRSDISPKPLLPSFWIRHGREVREQYQLPSFDGTTTARDGQYPQTPSSAHSAWQTYRSGVMA